MGDAEQAHLEYFVIEELLDSRMKVLDAARTKLVQI